MITKVFRHRAALHRRELSRPLALALQEGLLHALSSFFDFGCGHGDDLRILGEWGISGEGWDPVFQPHTARREADVVNLGYVLNVIEDGRERKEALLAAWGLARRVLIVAARLKHDERHLKGDVFADGVLTKRCTFQKLYEQQELRSYIEQVIGVTPIAAAPGIFYVFRDEQLREAVAATRVRRAPTRVRATPDELFRAHEEVLMPILDFLNVRGRTPEAEELPSIDRIIGRLGSLRRALLVVRRAISGTTWETVEMLRTEDLLVYLALARFQRRPSFGALPRELQLDVRAFFGSYGRACALADEILMAVGNTALIERACRASSVGKLTPAALYLHVSALEHAPPLLRVYEGCARNCAGFPDRANILKLHRTEPKISYVWYPEFEIDPHPALATSVVVCLKSLRVDLHDYRKSTNQPILHRKECFVAADHLLRAKFARLTAREERAGLYERPEAIGTRAGWNSMLHERHVRLVGHRLIKA